MRYAICNETFEGWDHARICRFIAGLGYQGLEVAPFTLAARITEVSAESAREMRKQAEDHGVQIIGLHWLLAKTTGLMLTSPEASVRAGDGELPGGAGPRCRRLRRRPDGVRLAGATAHPRRARRRSRRRSGASRRSRWRPTASATAG